MNLNTYQINFIRRHPRISSSKFLQSMSAQLKYEQSCTEEQFLILEKFGNFYGPLPQSKKCFQIARDTLSWFNQRLHTLKTDPNYFKILCLDDWNEFFDMYPADFANFAFEDLSKTVRFIQILNKTYSYLNSQLDILDEVDKNDSIHSISIFPYKPNSWKKYLDELNEYTIKLTHCVEYYQSNGQLTFKY